MSRRRLSDEERALWRGFTRSISPLRPRPASEDDTAAASAAEPRRPRPAPVRMPPAAAAKSHAPPLPPLAPLGRRIRKRIASGGQPIDARLDLHGMTQSEAHDALFGFLKRTQARGGRLALIITGKGTGESSGRGVLKRLVPLWLRLPEFRALVAGFENAALRHGGEGALYVTIRKARDGDA